MSVTSHVTKIIQKKWMLIGGRYLIQNIYAKNKIPTKTEQPPSNLQCPIL